MFRPIVLALGLASAVASADDAQPRLVECQGTFVKTVDDVDPRLDQAQQEPYHALFEIGSTSARVLEGGALMTPSSFTKSPEEVGPDRLAFVHEGFTLLFYKSTGRFELVSYRLVPGRTASELIQATGTCSRFEQSHVFD